MKKAILITVISFSGLLTFAQTTATDFTVNDCNGVSHNLFSELDAGKVIVIGWTMPCSTCATPLLEVHNAVLGFMGSHPGVVEFWMTDDYANSTCSNISGWGSTYGITNATYFSSSEIAMSDYGSDGMPKVVIVACQDHKIYYNVNDFPNGAGATAAINSALADLASGCLVGTNTLEKPSYELTCYPNPASQQLTVEFNIPALAEVTIELITLRGQVVMSVPVEKINQGIQTQSLNIEAVPDGLYFLKIGDSKTLEVVKVQIIN